MGISEACIHEMDSAVMPQYITNELGIPIVIFNSVYKNVCKNCGEESHLIQYPDRLIAAAAVGRCKMPLKLTGKEIKFVRKAMDMSSKELAEHLDVAAETFSRWENDKAPIAPMNEKMLRLSACIKLGSLAPAMDFKIQDILNMNIRAVRAPDEDVCMAFELVRFKEAKEKPTTEEYTEQAKAA
jgi:DNA-binding transcriptional regulator YiaG